MPCGSIECGFPLIFMNTKQIMGTTEIKFGKDTSIS